MTSLRRHASALMLACVMALTFGTSAVRGAELVMFESDFCEWCAAWHAEIGPIYPKTSEGRRAPLRTVDLHDERPKDLADIPDNVKNELEIIPVSRAGEVLERALVRKPEPIDWVEPVDQPAASGAVAESGEATTVAH